jgi:hypothetical protein
MGLHRAGFDVTGVDIRPQPNYPFRFVQGDALRPPFDLSEFDFIWASPPCQAYSWAAKRWKSVERADLIEPVRDLLTSQNVPFCIENVVGAPIRVDLVLMGQMFGLRVIKRRHFELHGFWAMQPVASKPGRIGFGPNDFVTVAGHGGNGSARLANWQDATGIDWMTKKEMAEAIPPAYAEFIGRAALARVQSPIHVTTNSVACAGQSNFAFNGG